MTTTPPDPDDDFLDAPCDPDDEMREPTADDEVDALVLFADVEFTDPAAVEQRRAEWTELAALGGAESDA
jgi:hypothetical protein